MNTPLKVLLAFGALVVMGFTSLFLITRTYLDATKPLSDNYMTFSGTGKVIAKPDIATTSFSIVTEATTSKVAQDENSKKSRAVIAYLKGQKVDEKDIKTTGYNIYPTYAYPVGGAQKIVGYQVNQTVSIKIRDIDRANEILDGIINSGVNQVNGIEFSIDDIDKVKAEARKMAIDEAKKKAKEISKQLGIDLGDITNFSEDNVGSPRPLYYDKAVGGFGGGAESAPALPSGENEIQSSVTITYELE